MPCGFIPVMLCTSPVNSNSELIFFSLRNQTTDNSNSDYYVQNIKAGKFYTIEIQYFEVSPKNDVKFEVSIQDANIKTLESWDNEWMNDMCADYIVSCPVY